MPDFSAFCPVCGASTTKDQFAARDLQDRVLSAIAYVGLLPALILLLIPAFRRAPSVRFHSCQSLLFSVGSVIVALLLRLSFFVFSFLPLLAWLLLGIGPLALFILWLVLILEAARGRGFELPWLGPLAARIATAGPR